MEPPPKRQRRQDHDTNESSRRDEPGHTPFGGHHANAFDGTGIQSSGNFTVAGDLHINVDSLKKEKRKEGETAEQKWKATSEARRKLLGSLRFPQIDAREFGIKKAHASTCEWVLMNDQYMRWAQSRQNTGSDKFIWLKGKPGAGKSTIMKFLLEYIRRQPEETDGNEILISFFFNARGAELEKNILGLYRSLLLQLLEKIPENQDVLDVLDSTHEWTINSLESVFEQAASNLIDVSLICLIDALDECGISQVRNMVDFFSRLTQTHTRLHVCFASRHYPHISIVRSLEIILERQPEHQEDITRYLSSKLQIGHSRVADQICSDILAKASGVFMWVVLVVDILNREFDAGRKHTLRKRLDELPEDLHTLFHDILTRDTENVEGLLLCIQWILFAQRPLTPQELYFAIISGREPEHLETCHIEDISADDIRKYILDNSKGLAEPFGNREATVQFIHESVVDFLIKDNGLAKIFTHLRNKLHGNSHNSLKLCCLKYIEFMQTPDARIPEHTPFGPGIPQFPFSSYASDHFVFHADQAESDGIDQKDFVADLNIGKWKTSVHDLSFSLLYILASRGATSLIRAHSEDRSCFTIEKKSKTMPIIAAVVRNKTETTLALLEMEVRRVPALSFQDLCRRASPLENSTTSDTEILRDDVDIFVQLVTLGPELASIVFLRTIGSNDLNVTDDHKRTPLFYAIVRHHYALVEHLVALGADLSHCDGVGAMASHWAARFGTVEALDFLESNMCRLDARDHQGRTPLHYAISSGSVMLLPLLRRGVDIDAKDRKGLTPLHYAMGRGLLEHAKTLLSKGADASAGDEQGQTPLGYALWYNRYVDGAISLLQKYGVDISAVNSNGETLLHCFLGQGRDDCARTLLFHGASISKPDRNRYTPIWWAVYAPQPDPNLITSPTHLRTAPTSGPPNFNILILQPINFN